MRAFNYHRPTSLEEIGRILGSATDASLLAGGQSLIPSLKQRLAEPSDLVDLGGVPELAGIRVDGGEVRIGAMTRHADVAASKELAQRIPALAALADSIGDHQVRNRGTLGGSIANNDPAADYPAAVVGLDATVETNQREIPADEFFVDLFDTALEPGEIVTAVRFKAPEAAGYGKFPQPASRFALVGVMVARYADSVRVAVTGAGMCVFRVPEMEQALTSDFSEDAIRNITIPADDLNTDLHATAAYRAHLVGVMARKAVATALG
ncbi:MAG TPA: xanthine dehydrogenase family protein subunit M [Salinisphaeraceae bacterium]|nr:xanthine dehydrogenase family protein subunit M [Salinisphaeraceae bacterium]